MKKLIVIALFLISNLVLANDLSQYAGYTIVANKYVTGYVDRDGKLHDDFEGCDYDRKIIFDDGTYLTCQSYSYSYSYHPQATLLVRGSTWVMIVDSNAYNMSN